jgi:hypothetical protein
VEGSNPKDWRHLGDWRVLVEGPYKFGWSSNDTHFLVNLAEDPEERLNLVTEQPERAQRLAEALELLIQRMPKPGATGAVEQATPEELEKLRGLGY